MTDTPRLPVNAEARVVAYLRSRSEMTTLADDRIFTVLPKGLDTWPALRVTQLDQQNVGRNPVTLHMSYVQLEAFGGTKAQAHQLAATAQALLDLQAFRSAGITATDPGRLRDEPDSTYTPAKPRWLFTVTIWSKPTD